MLYLYYCKSHSALEKKKRHSAIILSSKRVGDLLGNFVQLWEAKYFKIFSMMLIECYTGKVAVKMLWRKREEINWAETSPGKPEMILQTNADPWEHTSFETPSSMAFTGGHGNQLEYPYLGLEREIMLHTMNYLFYISFLASSKRKKSPHIWKGNFSPQWTAAACPVFF